MILGIDLGTTHSLAAYWDGGQCRLIPNHRGSPLTPSVVSFKENGDVLVGQGAKNQALVNPQGTCSGFKRAMGTEEIFPLKGRNLTATDLSALVLESLRQDACRALGEDCRQAVISVPAYFSEPQRSATLQAAYKAGWKMIRLINEPTAASLAYAQGQVNDGLILVYDWGGGTFDVTVMEKQGREFFVRSCAGHPKLGGMDIDQILYEKALEYFRKASESPLDDPVVLQDLRGQAERAKIDLSHSFETSLALPFLSTGGRSQHLSWDVSRSDLEAWIEPLVDQTLELVALARSQAQWGEDQPGQLVLSGGSTRIPLVQKKLLQAFNLKTSGSLNPEEAVVWGAAFQGALLDQRAEGALIRDITPYALGIEVEEGKFFPLVGEGARVPFSRSHEFTTIADDQEAVEIHIQQRQGSSTVTLGRFLLSGIHREKAGVPRIRVQFTMDDDGILHVKARDLGTGARQDLLVTAFPGAHGTAAGPLEELKNLLDHHGESQDPEWTQPLKEAQKALDARDEHRAKLALMALKALVGERRVTEASHG